MTFVRIPKSKLGTKFLKVIKSKPKENQHQQSNTISSIGKEKGLLAAAAQHDLQDEKKAEGQRKVVPNSKVLLKGLCFFFYFISPHRPFIPWEKVPV